MSYILENIHSNERHAVIGITSDGTETLGRGEGAQAAKPIKGE